MIEIGNHHKIATGRPDRSPQAMRVSALTAMVSLFAMISLFTSSALAGRLTLGTNSPIGTPLLMEPGGPATTLLVTTAGDGTAANLADFVTGWQALLRITPETDASGTIRFQSPLEPAKYLFGTIGSFGINASLSTSDAPDDTVFASDFNFPFTGGTDVPLSQAANLLSVELLASADARGTFGIFAINGVGNTEWSDASQPFSMRRTFANVPDGGGLVQIGQIVVSTRLVGDINGDQTVNRRDVALFVPFLGRSEQTSFDVGDFDGDQKVTLRDLALLQANLQSPSPSLTTRCMHTTLRQRPTSDQRRRDERSVAIAASRTALTVGSARPGEPRFQALDRQLAALS